MPHGAHATQVSIRVLLFALCLLATGFALLTLILLGVLGLTGVLGSNAGTASSAPEETILLVVPLEGLLPATPNAPLPTASALQAYVNVPVPTATPVVTPAVAELQGAVAPTPSAIGGPLTYRALFQEVGSAYGVDWRLLAALAFRESRMDPSAVGRDGDMGLMQIIPSTWREFAPPVSSFDPFDPRHNAEVAASYLRYLETYLAKHGHVDVPWILLAYNWGPDNVRKLLVSGGDWSQVPAHKRQYVAEILQAAYGVQVEAWD